MGSQVDYLQLKTLADKRLLDIRSIRRVIYSIKFPRIWANASESERNIFLSLVKATDRQGCWDWLDAKLKTELESLIVRDLRILARQKGIANYHHIDRESLILELKKHAIAT